MFLGLLVKFHYVSLGGHVSCMFSFSDQLSLERGTQVRSLLILRTRDLQNGFLWHIYSVSAIVPYYGGNIHDSMSSLHHLLDKSHEPSFVRA